MSKIGWIILAAVLVVGGASIASAEQKASAASWDEVATREVRQVVDRSLDAMAAMDSAAVDASMGNDVTGFDIDVEGKPVRIGTRVEAIHYFSDIFGWAKSSGARLKFDRKSTECHGTASLAFCALEYDFVAVMPDGSSVVQPTRTSVVLRKDADGWKWVHWHSSLSALPAPDSTPTAK